MHFIMKNVQNPNMNNSIFIFCLSMFFYGNLGCGRGPLMVNRRRSEEQCGVAPAPSCCLQTGAQCWMEGVCQADTTSCVYTYHTNCPQPVPVHPRCGKKRDNSNCVEMRDESSVTEFAANAPVDTDTVQDTLSNGQTIVQTFNYYSCAGFQNFSLTFGIKAGCFGPACNPPSSFTASVSYASTTTTLVVNCLVSTKCPLVVANTASDQKNSSQCFDIKSLYSARGFNCPSSKVIAQIFLPAPAGSNSSSISVCTSS